MNFRKMVLAICINFCFLYLCAQPTPRKGLTLKGHITGIEDGTKVYLYNIDEQKNIDSAVSSGGNFTIRGYVERPAACWLNCKDQYATIQVENTEMTFESPINNMHLLAVAHGGKEQKLQNELSGLQFPYEKIYSGAYDSIVKKLYADKEQRKSLEKILNDYQDSAQGIYVNFGKRHADSYLGLDILYRNRQRIGKDTIGVLYDVMGESLKATTKGQALKIFMYGELAEKGKKFIDFTAETLSGEPFTLSALTGKYILLSFWDAGCVPCRKENKKMSQNYHTLDNKLAIVSFSLDKSKSAWLKASKDDHILWTNISDLKGGNGRIKTQYDVQAIPTSFLINKEGLILERFTGFSDDFLDQLGRLIKDN